MRIAVWMTVGCWLVVAATTARSAPFSAQPVWESGDAGVTRGLAAADLDRDGRLDLLCANDFPPNSLYSGAPRFFAAVSSWGPAGVAAGAVAAGDVDGDGLLDVVLGCPGRNRLYLNAGGMPAAAPAWTSQDRLSTLAVALGDVDGDGFLDLVCAESDTAASRDRFSLYLGDGTAFVEPPAWIRPARGKASGVALGDIDGDGRLDVVCAATGGNALYLGAAGVFADTSAWSPDTTLETQAIALGDIDGDGDLDAVCANGATAPRANRAYLNSGTALDTTAVWVAGAADLAYAVDLGDVDGDGRLDAVFGVDGPNTCYLNTGGTFGPAPAWTSPRDHLTHAVVLADADGDGDLDLVCGSAPQTNTVYENLSPPYADAAGWTTSAPAPALALALGDVDGDGRPDLVLGNQGANQLYPGAGTAFAPDPAWVSTPAGVTVAVALGDIDGDGDLDLVCGNAGANTAYTNAAGQLDTDPSWTSSDALLTTDVALGDIDGDGDLDLACASASGNNVIYFNTGAGLAAAAGWSAPGDGATGVALGDVDGDGDLDVVFSNTNGRANTMYRNDGGVVTAAPVWSSSAQNSSSSVALGDIDGDGDLDVVFGNVNQAATLYRNTGGVFTAAPVWSSARTWNTRDVALGDVDGDGDLDLVCGHDTPTAGLYLNNAGTFAASPVWEPSAMTNVQGVAPGDVDGDGDLDVVCAAQGAPAAAFLSRRNPPGGIDATNPSGQRPNNPAFVASGRIEDTGPNARTVTFTAVDVESDPVYLVVEYAFAGEGNWHDAAVDGAGPFAASPAGREHAFTWDITALPFASRDVMLRLRAVETPGRVSAVRAVPAWIADAGPVTPVRPEIALSPRRIDFPTLSVGDTLRRDVVVTNRGNVTLDIAGVRLPSPEMRVVPERVPSITPGDSTVIAVYLEPVDGVDIGGLVTIESSDPLHPVDSVVVATDVRALAVTTRLLTGSETIPLGEAATVIVEPAPGVRIERGSLFHRRAGAGAFYEVALARSGGDFVALIPGARVTEGGVEYYVEVHNDPASTTDPPAAPRDSLYYQAVTSPTSIALTPRPTLGSDFVAGEDIRVDVQMPQGGVFDSGTLHYRAGGAQKYTSTSITVAYAVPSAVIPAGSVGPGGLDYWAEVRTATTVLTDPPGGSKAPASLQILVSDLVEPRSHRGGAYRLFSIPLEMRGSILAALANDVGGVDNTRWRLFGYDTDAAGYTELPSADERAFMQGRAYWLVTRDDHRIDIADDDGLTAVTGQPWNVVLAPGYNLIADPFAFEVAWETCRVDTLPVLDSLATTMVEPPVGWDPDTGYAFDVKTLVPFDGYWVRNLTDAPLLLRIPPLAAPERRMASSGSVPGTPSMSPAGGGWRLTVTASAAGAADVPDAAALLGGLAGARDDRDRFDRSHPPLPPGRRLAVCFPHGEWDTAPGPYARDLRAVEPLEGAVWCFDVSKSFTDAGGGDEVTLRVDGADTLGEGVRAVLVDRRLGVHAAMDDGGVYRFFLGLHQAPARADDARFALIVGSDAYVLEAAAALAPPPVETALHQNHPNPFNPATVIRYDLSEPARVTLRVYDVRGALVRVLEDRERGPGRYEVGWDGTGDRGNRVASGIYFCRLEAGRFTATRKMLLLK